MYVQLLKCNDPDSICTPGTEHKFPIIGAGVTTWGTCELAVVGSADFIEVKRGDLCIVAAHHTSTHEVIVDHMPTGTKVWLDIRDIEGLGE